MLASAGAAVHLVSPAAREAPVEERLLRSQIDVSRISERLRGVVYAGYYGHWDRMTQDDNIANPVLAQIGFDLAMRPIAHARRRRGRSDCRIATSSRPISS